MNEKKMSNSHLIAELDGETYCYLHSSNTISGGGSYLTRVLDARNKTKADVFVFVLPNGDEKDRIHARIRRTVKSLEESVAPMKLPFRVAVSYANL